MADRFLRNAHAGGRFSPVRGEGESDFAVHAGRNCLESLAGTGGECREQKARAPAQSVSARIAYKLPLDIFPVLHGIFHRGLPDNQATFLFDSLRLLFAVGIDPVKEELCGLDSDALLLNVDG